MVFTVRVRRAEHGLSRRGVLAAAVGGLAAVGLGGCDIGSTTALWHLAPDKLLPFLASTVALADTYDAAMRRLPALTAQLSPLRDDHRQHVTALRRELGLAETAPSPTPAPPTSPPPTSAAPPTSPPPTSAPPTSAPPTSAPPTSGAPGTAGPTGSATPSTSARSSSDPSIGTSASASIPPSQAPTPTDPALPGDRAGLIAVLQAAERKGQQDAVTACLAAPTYRAALLGSIAACRATHLTVLG
jgi:hypothetical protein